MFTRYIPDYKSVADRLMEVFTRVPLDAFTDDDWDILCHLPASKHWNMAADTPLSAVLELEYKVIQISDLLDEDDSAPFITDPEERAMLER